ncbi:redoxin domain-containing protein [Flavitalea sp. BT771]|uniref:redoxin domain-containing protein n=1 Tax=Flavitalea sp. BT771 TaxID=3063329 RepID=UPI0026E2D95B|nr:redoxin domain-containing protein [Flavitalea sp. BT771]MDO6433368.1 redoxin domain-containing protein [Flavitalea sp. BT771]MDV6222727.1 redoxin domain-containing protein [Flavitalea sp. BT771]
MPPVSKIFLLCSFLTLAFIAGVRAQDALDSVQLRNVKGKTVSYASVKGGMSLVLVCFWSVNSEVSIREVTAISQQWARMKHPVHFTVLALCVDQGNLLSHMRNTAFQNDWAFEVYGDVNGDLQRAFHYTNPPLSLIVDKGEVVYQQSGFEPGTEQYLFSRIQSLAAGK